MQAQRYLEEFYPQLEFEEGLSLNLDGHRGVIFCGMGGSAIVGDLVKSWLEHRKFDKPVFSYRGYALPSFVKDDFLVVCVSYSGNTEETLSNFLDAVKRGIRPVCLSSGGRLMELAHKHGCRHVKLPSGFAPRFALGFMLSKALCLMGIEREELEDARENLSESVELIKERAKSIALRFQNRIPLIYATPLTEAVATRWKAEINENAKSPCYRAVLPEMHHNEVVGLSNPLTRNKFAFLIMHDVKDTERVKLRVEITLRVLKEYGVNPIHLSYEGNSYLSRMLSLIHTGDWVSLYLAELYGYDPMPVRAIDSIKEMLFEL